MLLLVSCTKEEVKEEKNDPSLLEEYYSEEIKEQGEEISEKIIETPQPHTNKKSEAEKEKKRLTNKIKEQKKSFATSEEKNKTLLHENNSYYEVGYDLYKQGVKDLEKKDYASAIDFFNQAEEMLNRINS